ncbi:MFS transporter [Micromonospora polyrhachis]|uniref:Putative MFS family arabinose efflux permease n=1 Tax=Micromonospora polyrhachis TaxID=1282883 RepID=A0A7W7SS49_9ACTN|nr:MFS transporter [Micromonospora polyrhachis]MBB4959965.1 putative MFS family arabinose efflux permease [Micromonospora polyrhachis]
MPRLIHDRITWLTYAQLGVWGFFLYGFGPVVPLLRDEQGTSAAVASLHSTSVALGALIGGYLFPLLTRRFDRGPVLWCSLAGIAVGAIGLTTLRPLPATLAAVVVAATFGTMVVCGVNTVLADHHRSAAPAAISEANAACAGLGVLAPLVIGLAVSAGIGWRPALAVEVALIALVALAAVTFRVRLPQAASAAAAAETGSRRLPRAYWLAWALMSVTGSIEICLSLWGADVLRTHAGLSRGAASAALAAIVGGMFLGRLVGGRIALRVAPVPLLLGALSVSLLGFTLFWAFPVGWIAVAGLMIMGLGNAMHYPLGISIALAAAKGQADRAAGYSSYAMAVGSGIAPVVLGWVADGVGPHLAFLLLPVFIAVSALLALRLGRILRPRVSATPPPTPAPV